MTASEAKSWIGINRKQREVIYKFWMKQKGSRHSLVSGVELPVLLLSGQRRVLVERRSHRVILDALMVVRRLLTLLKCIAQAVEAYLTVFEVVRICSWSVDDVRIWRKTRAAQVARRLVRVVAALAVNFRRNEKSVVIDEMYSDFSSEGQD